MKKLLLLVLVSISMLLAGCKDNYPTFSQFSDVEEGLFEEIRSVARDSSRDGQKNAQLPVHFWQSWERKSQHVKDIQRALEASNLIRNNKLLQPAVNSDRTFDVISHLVRPCYAEWGFEKGYAYTKICNMPIDQAIKVFADLYSPK